MWTACSKKSRHSSPNCLPPHEGPWLVVAVYDWRLSRSPEATLSPESCATRLKAAELDNLGWDVRRDEFVRLLARNQFPAGNRRGQRHLLASKAVFGFQPKVDRQHNEVLDEAEQVSHTTTIASAIRWSLFHIGR